MSSIFSLPLYFNLNKIKDISNYMVDNCYRIEMILF